MGTAQAFLISKLVHAGLLAAGAVLALLLGYWIFKGKAGRAKDGTMIKWQGGETQVGTVEAVIMLSACVFAYCR